MRRHVFDGVYEGAARVVLAFLHDPQGRRALLHEELLANHPTSQLTTALGGRIPRLDVDGLTVGRLPLYSFWYAVLGVRELGRLLPLLRLAELTPSWWPYADRAVLARRPVARVDRGAEFPSLRFADGTVVGVARPAQTVVEAIEEARRRAQRRPAVPPAAADDRESPDRP